MSPAEGGGPQDGPEVASQRPQEGGSRTAAQPEGPGPGPRSRSRPPARVSRTQDWRSSCRVLRRSRRDQATIARTGSLQVGSLDLRSTEGVVAAQHGSS